MTRRTPKSTPLPYATLSRSPLGRAGFAGAVDRHPPDRLAARAGGGQEERVRRPDRRRLHAAAGGALERVLGLDRKSTRLNSSHANISYAVFCLTKKSIACRD